MVEGLDLGFDTADGYTSYSSNNQYEQKNQESVNTSKTVVNSQKSSSNNSGSTVNNNLVTRNTVSAPIINSDTPREELLYHLANAYAVLHEYESHLNAAKKYTDEANKKISGTPLVKFIKGYFILGFFVLALVMIFSGFSVVGEGDLFGLLGVLVGGGIVGLYVYLFMKKSKGKVEFNNKADIERKYATDFLNQHYDKVTFLSSEYRNCMSTAFFYDVLNNGRADNMKEAMNLFEVQKHQWKVEQYNKMMFENQKNIERQIRENRVDNAFALGILLLSKF